VLARRWQRGDLASASILIQRYEGVVYAAALRLLRDPADAEDLTQDTFLRAHEQIGSLRDGGAVGAWLRTICVRRGLNVLRRRTPRFEDLDDHDPIDTAPGPEEVTEGRDALARFDEALRRLPEGQRLAIVLCDVEELPQAEVADLLGTTVPAVKMRLQRGRHALRGLLKAGEL
jgi:RNA polymerase sigma-70 factor (ECF subfamily)